MPTTEDFELLGCLVEADIKAGEPEAFTLVARPGMGGYEFASRRGWPDEAPAPSHLRVDELEDFGWVRVTSSTAGKNRIFAVTSAGREGWNRYVAQQQHVPGYVDLDWTPAREVLERIYRLYRDQGAPERGVDTLPMASDPDDGKQVEALIRELLRADLLEDVRSSAAGPRFVRPSPETFRRLAGWPADTATEALNELVAAFNTQIQQTADAGEKSKLEALRDGLLGVGRQLFLSWAENKTKGLG